MQLQLKDITINDLKVIENLKSYLFKISNFKNFQPTMPLRIFVNKDKDFTAFESVDYNLQFTSAAHKMIETIKSPYPFIETDFRTFHNFLNYLA